VVSVSFSESLGYIGFVIDFVDVICPGNIRCW